MKAITICQPWAGLIAVGEKIYETRSWPTKYRGPIAIHAGKSSPLRVPITPGLEEYANHNEKLGNWLWLPCGGIIAIGELVNCWYIVHHPGTDVDIAKNIDIGAESMVEDEHAPGFGDYFVPTPKEVALGDWTPGRYAWEIRKVRILERVPQVEGQFGLWNWDENAPQDIEWKLYNGKDWVRAARDPFTGEKYFIPDKEGGKT